MEQIPVAEISQVITLAVAPVFLLAGIAGFLTILSHRLSRVVDRTRHVSRFIRDVKLEDHKKPLDLEMCLLAKRTQLINWALRFSVCGALAICLVIMCLFVSEFVLINMGSLIALLFISAMVLVIMSLLLLLMEVNISTSNLRNDIEHLLVKPSSE
jgi:hypothetical protein|tara:strand:+ start:1276 stop:1743 length:468 start_codon:yes stop_codon:yes gene_type:complete